MLGPGEQRRKVTAERHPHGYLLAKPFSFVQAGASVA
jgi:hypothetical protein